MIPACELIEQADAVIFDLFHTLTSVESTNAPGPLTSETLGVTPRQWEKQLLEHSRYRLAGEITDPYEIIGRMARAIVPGISQNIIHKAADIRICRFDHSIRHIPRKNKDVIELLKRKGKKVGLCSNADCVEVRKWDESILAGVFDSTVISCHVGCVKPEPEIFLLSLNELGTEPEKAVFVGDGGSNELEAAGKLGMKTVMTVEVIEPLWPHLIPERIHGADSVIKELSELIKEQ